MSGRLALARLCWRRRCRYLPKMSIDNLEMQDIFGSWFTSADEPLLRHRLSTPHRTISQPAWLAAAIGRVGGYRWRTAACCSS